MIHPSLLKSLNVVSEDYGIIKRLYRMPRINGDPKLVNYGIKATNLQAMTGFDYSPKSGGCGHSWENSVMSGIGETLERYCSAFVDKAQILRSSYNELDKEKIPIEEYSLFNEKQYDNPDFAKMISRFTPDLELSWTQAYNLRTGRQTFVPAQFIYLPYYSNEQAITIGVSTGLASHTDFYKAILVGLYEALERDSFSITWYQKIVPPKIIITEEISQYIDNLFPTRYDWHFFDITYDLKVPTIFGFCIGKAEYGDFIAFGAASRFTMAEALKKTIMEIGQSIPFFRYILNDHKHDPAPSNDYSRIQDFDMHSWFYLARKDKWKIFDPFINASPTRKVDLSEKDDTSPKNQIKSIVERLDKVGCDVLVKDLTTPDVHQAGFYVVKTYIPQLVPLSGAYPLYFLGGKRLFSVPLKAGYQSNDFDGLNKEPHPFP